MEAIGRLSGGVAHDFNNLLVVITGYSEMLLMDRYQNDRDLLRKYVEEIVQAGERAAGLTRQLLAFSRQQVLQPQVLNLNDVVSNLEKMLRRLIGEDIDLVSIPGKYLGQVKADPGQIEQVILNLVVNARDAMPTGGKLTIETANVELDEAYAQKYIDVTPGRYVLLTVSDSGVGMDANVQSHIFEPFFTTKEQGKGTGLGLATVYGIVKQSGGDIRLYSELEQGTTFKVYLPRVDEAVTRLESRPAISEIPTGGETLVLVEDEASVRALARQALELSGYTVLEASCGPEALELCQQLARPIHLLVTDVVMPGGMNGRELAEQLRSLRPELKVLFISGYTNEAIVHHGVLGSGYFFLQKPFTPYLLMQKVREVLDAPEPE
jgi:CheY-like chemotaxis protein